MVCRPFVLLWLIVAGAGCELLLPYEKPKSAALLPRDSISDLSLDGGAQSDAGQPIKLIISADLPATISAGGHLILKVSSQGGPFKESVRISAAPCGLTRQSLAPTDTLFLQTTLPPQNELDHWVIWAPLSAAPGTCQLQIADPRVELEPFSVEIVEPAGALFERASQTLPILAQDQALPDDWQIEGVTYAGGSYGGAWLVLVQENDATSTEQPPIAIYRVTERGAEPGPWVSQVARGDARDIRWTAGGPCPGRQGLDQLYVAVGGGEGGIYCISPTGQVAKAATGSYSSLDADPFGGFVELGAQHALYGLNWSIFRIWPGDIEWIPDGMSNAQQLTRFVPRGLWGGYMFLLNEDGSLLRRISPGKNEVEEYISASSMEWLAVTSSPTFGEALAFATSDPTDWFLYRLFLRDLSGQPARILAAGLPCGRRLSFSASGDQLAVVTNDGCQQGEIPQLQIYQLSLP